MRTYTRDEAADFLKCDRSTVSLLFATGQLPGAKVGRRMVFRDMDLEAYLNSTVETQTENRRTIVATPPAPRGRPRRVFSFN